MQLVKQTQLAELIAASGLVGGAVQAKNVTIAETKYQNSSSKTEVHTFADGATRASASASNTPCTTSKSQPPVLYQYVHDSSSGRALACSTSASFTDRQSDTQRCALTPNRCTRRRPHSACDLTRPLRHGASASNSLHARQQKSQLGLEGVSAKLQDIALAHHNAQNSDGGNSSPTVCLPQHSSTPQPNQTTPDTDGTAVEQLNARRPPAPRPLSAPPRPATPSHLNECASSDTTAACHVTTTPNKAVSAANNQNPIASSPQTRSVLPEVSVLPHRHSWCSDTGTQSSLDDHNEFGILQNDDSNELESLHNDHSFTSEDTPAFHTSIAVSKSRPVSPRGVDDDLHTAIMNNRQEQTPDGIPDDKSEGTVSIGKLSIDVKSTRSQDQSHPRHRQRNIKNPRRHNWVEQSLIASDSTSDWKSDDAHEAPQKFKALQAAKALAEKAKTAQMRAEQRCKTAEARAAALTTTISVLQQEVSQKTAMVEQLSGKLASRQLQHEQNEQRLQQQLLSIKKAEQKQLQMRTEIEKKANDDLIEKLRNDLAKRTQTIMAVHTDLERSQKLLDEQKLQMEDQAQQISILQQRVAELAVSAPITSTSTSMSASTQPPKPVKHVSFEDDTQDNDNRPPQQQAIDKDPQPQVPSSTATGNQTTTNFNNAGSYGQPRPPGSPAPCPHCGIVSNTHTSEKKGAEHKAATTGVDKQGANGWKGDPTEDEQYVKLRMQLKKQLAEVHHDHALRLSSLERTVERVASIHEGRVRWAEDVVAAMVARVGSVLAGRISGVQERGKLNKEKEEPAPSGRRLNTCNSVVLNPTMKALHQLNLHLATENASLIAEVAKMQRARNRPASASATVTHAASSPAPAPSPITPTQAAMLVSQQELMLATKEELLPVVLTKQTSLQTFYDDNSKTANSIKAAEQNLSLRARVMELEQQVVQARSQTSAVGQAQRAAEEQAEDLKGVVDQQRKELSRLHQQISKMVQQRSYGTVHNSDVDMQIIDYEDAEHYKQLEATAQAAKEEVARQKFALAAIKRDKEAKEKLITELEAKYERLEVKMGNMRQDSSKQQEVIRDLRSSLAQAKLLLQENGLLDGSGDFTDAEDLTVKLNDAVLLRAVDARDKEREARRLVSEVEDLEAQLAEAHKEARKLKRQLVTQQTTSDLAVKDKIDQIILLREQIEKDAKKYKGAIRSAEEKLTQSIRQRLDLETSLQQLSKELERTKLDLEYFKTRASKPRLQPHLMYTQALSMTVTQQLH